MPVVGRLRKVDIGTPPELKGRAVIVPAFTVLPVFKGTGNRSYGCGGCGVTMIGGLTNDTDIAGIVIQCPKCKTYKDVRV